MQDNSLEYTIEKVENGENSYFSRIKNDVLFSIIDNDISPVKSNRLSPNLKRKLPTYFLGL